jgi:hypothetical protein
MYGRIGVGLLFWWPATLGLSMFALVLPVASSATASPSSPPTTISPPGGPTRTTAAPQRSGENCHNSTYAGHSARPRFLRRAMRAVPLHGQGSSTPDSWPPGAVVPRTDIVSVARDENGVSFALADYRDPVHSTYPALSTDGGSTWQVDGPMFWVAAADGPAVTSRVGAFGPEGAYFWGEGGNAVKVTTDEGAHWWTTGFGAGVFHVTASHGILRAVALGNQVSCSEFQAFLYVSSDSGRIWTLRRELRHVTL